MKTMKINRVGYSLLIIFALFSRQSFAEKKLFVLLGQSNMAGRASIELTDLNVLNNVFLLNAEGDFIAARNPLNQYSNIRKPISYQRLGLGYSFAKEISKIYPQDSIYLIVNAKGGTPIEDFSKNSHTKYYEKTINRVKTALSKDDKLKLQSIIWHQGESNKSNPEVYIKQFKKLVKDYRTDLNKKDLPIIVGQLGLWNDDYSQIRNEIEKLPKLINRVWLVPSNHLTNFDGHHFDSKSQRIFGKRYARTYVKEVDGIEIDDIFWLRKHLENSNENYTMVVAHRGDWRNAPENSLQAIQNSIDMGVDMVEIDVQMTKDSVLVLMHDNTIDRTTNGKGDIREMSYDSIQKFWLQNGVLQDTPHKIPTLEQALNIAKDKILINLDTKDYKNLWKYYELLKKTETLDQVVIKANIKKKEAISIFGDYLDDIYFMPIVRTYHEDAYDRVDEYLKEKPPVAFEFTVPSDTVPLFKRFKEIRKMGTRVWVNSLTAHHCAGHNDEEAAIDSSVYDWFIENGTNIIQTDRPRLLLEYLRSKKLHD